VQTVRRSILEILKRRKSATVSELARQLDMAPVSVRYHLDILQGDNLIQVGTVHREGNVGRPKQLYSLTRQADDYFPDNLAPLTAGLICQMKKALPATQLEAAFCSLAREMAQEFCLEDQGEESFEDRMTQISGFLNERGYLARWEKDHHDTEGESYLLHTFNCPYAGISTQHRELCQMDLELVRELVGQPCQRENSLAEEGHCCTYRIHTENLPQEKRPEGMEIVLS
jgi:predicted ArsR family transcriptional regulator